VLLRNVRPNAHHYCKEDGAGEVPNSPVAIGHSYHNVTDDAEGADDDKYCAKTYGLCA